VTFNCSRVRGCSGSLIFRTRSNTSRESQGSREEAEEKASEDGAESDEEENNDDDLGDAIGEKNFDDSVRVDALMGKYDSREGAGPVNTEGGITMAEERKGNCSGFRTSSSLPASAAWMVAPPSLVVVDGL